MRRLLLPLIASILLGAPATALGQAPEPQTNLADISDEVMCTVCGVPLELALEAPQAWTPRNTSPAARSRSSPSLGWPVVNLPRRPRGYASHPAPFATLLARVLEAELP